MFLFLLLLGISPSRSSGGGSSGGGYGSGWLRGAEVRTFDGAGLVTSGKPSFITLLFSKSFMNENWGESGA